MYTKKYIDVITLALVSLIFILINVYQYQIQDNIDKLLEQTKPQEQIQISNENVVEGNQNELFESKSMNEVNSIIGNSVELKETKTLNINQNDEIQPVNKSVSEAKAYPNTWNIIIPEIDLFAPISEGTSQEILNKTVGHFEETSLLNGNVCLAAHNRGYNVNFFEKLKDLSMNSVIIYQFGDRKIVYSVIDKVIIKETDWSYIEKETSDNMITLITCVEDQPEYRLCVQAKEIKEKR